RGARRGGRAVGRAPTGHRHASRARCRRRGRDRRGRTRPHPPQRRGDGADPAGRADGGDVRPAMGAPPGPDRGPGAGPAAGGAGPGLALPDGAVPAPVLLAVRPAVPSAPRWGRRPALIAVPVLAALPVALLSYTPLGAHVTGFSGGLEVSWWLALGEVLLGLLTVWPMALGVVIAVLWWPGLVTAMRTASHRWLAVAWVVTAVIYLDAALDSPLGLSALYYRGQDRLAMPLAMLSAVLVVPGLQCWARLL